MISELVCIIFSFLVGLIHIMYLTDKNRKSFLQTILETIILYFLSFFLLFNTIKYSRLLLETFSIKLLNRSARNLGPLVFFILDYHTSEHIKIKNLQYICVIPSLIILIYLAIGFMNGIPFKKYTGYNWSYHALTHWSLAFVIGTLLSYQKIRNPITSLNFGFQSIVTAGWLYELPISDISYMFFHETFPMFIKSPIISLAIIIWILNKYKFLPNRTFLTTTAIFLAFSIMYGLTGIRGFSRWFRLFVPRVPATVMILSTTTGIRGQST